MTHSIRSSTLAASTVQLNPSKRLSFFFPPSEQDGKRQSITLAGTQTPLQFSERIFVFPRCLISRVRDCEMSFDSMLSD
jgi:hypothetical protein